MIPTILCITEQGSRVVKRGRVLLVYKNRQKIFMYPLENISQLLIMGRVEVSTAMLSLLMRSGVDTVFLRRDGRFKGRLKGEWSKNIFVREQQFTRRRDPAFCLAVSKQLVAAKIANARNLLRRRQPETYRDLKRRLNNALGSVEQAPDTAVLRGLEGSFASLYFSVFPRLLKNPLGFKKRIKHPPPDPVNILLSFGYTLLFNAIYALVDAAGLDPYAGVFHQSSYGHPTLVSDLMEPYRAPLIDRLVVHLLNEELIGADDFEKEEKTVRLRPEAVAKFLDAWQKRLFARYMLRENKETVWNILSKDVAAFVNYLQEKTDDYQPFIFR